MTSQNNDLTKTLIKSNKAPKKTKTRQEQQQTYVKDPEQECSRSKSELV